VDPCGQDLEVENELMKLIIPVKQKPPLVDPFWARHLEIENLLIRGDLWWTLAGKTSSGRKLLMVILGSRVKTNCSSKEKFTLFIRSCGTNNSFRAKLEALVGHAKKKELDLKLRKKVVPRPPKKKKEKSCE